MQPDVEIVEGELRPDVYEPPAAPTLFGTSDPKLALQRMSDVATLLVDVIRDRGLVARIKGREHLTAEAWTVLGALVGVTPVVTWSRPLDDGAGWEARVEARTLDGRVVGAAESMCTRAESTWRSRDEFALRSMAQTRAIGRALRAPLSPIAKLAGYEPAGAEELATSEPEPAAPTAGPPGATILQKQKIAALFSQLKQAAPEVDWATQCASIAGSSDELDERGAERVIEQIRAWLVELDGGEGD